MKIAVIGPGAMGLLFGSYLSQHHDVTLVGTNPAKMQSITENGVTIREMDGSERIYRPHATADTTGLSPVDLVIVQVKASASEAALTKNKALIGPDTILMTLQNGMGHETLLSRFAVACGNEAPLLPLGIGVVPQLDLGAVLDIIIGNLNDLAVGGVDGVVLTLGDHGLCNFLLGCHIGYLPIHKQFCKRIHAAYIGAA